MAVTNTNRDPDAAQHHGSRLFMYQMACVYTLNKALALAVVASATESAGMPSDEAI